MILPGAVGVEENTGNFMGAIIIGIIVWSTVIFLITRAIRRSKERKIQMMELMEENNKLLREMQERK